MLLSSLDLVGQADNFARQMAGPGAARNALCLCLPQLFPLVCLCPPAGAWPGRSSSECVMGIHWMRPPVGSRSAFLLSVLFRASFRVGKLLPSAPPSFL